MAEPQEPQLLSAFNTEAIADLKGAMDPREILVRAQEYPTLRNLLGDKNIKQKIGEALVKNDPERLRGVLLDVLNEAKTFEKQGMTEVPGADPFITEETVAATKLTTKEYVSRISEVENASKLVIEERKTAGRHRFAEDLTNNFIKQTRQTITEEQKQMEINRVERDLSIPDWYNNKEQITNTVGQSFFGGPIYQDAVDKTAKIAIAEADRVARDEERFETTIASVASSLAADEVVVQRPDVFIKIAADQAGRSTNTPVDKIIDRAVALERATEGFTGGGPALPQNLSLLATNPLQKIVAGAIDRLPTELRETVIANLSNSAWEKAVDTATRYYGRQVVNEPWFQQALANGNAGLASGKGALQSLINGPYKFLGDVATTVFRGSFDEATIAYVETVRLNITAVPVITYQQFYTAAVYGHNPGLLSYGINLGFQYGTRKATQALIKAGVKKAAVSTAVKVGAEAAAGAATGGLATLAMIGADLLRGLVNKGLSVFKSLVGMGTSGNPEDNLLLVVGAGVVLVFFLPIFPLLNLPAFNQSMIDTSLATSVPESGISSDSPIPPPNFGPINGSITDCIRSQGTNIEGAQTLTLSADRASRIQDISQKYPQLGCYSQVLHCPTTKINITAFAVQSGGLGGYAPSGAPGNIIFYPAFFQYDDYYFARSLAHEMMHEVEWFHSDIYDAFMYGSTDGSFNKGYCGPLGTYKAGDENSYETMSEAAALYMVGNPLLQQKCQPAYNFMRTLFSQCQK